jgi:hypothetical protein
MPIESVHYESYEAAHEILGLSGKPTQMINCGAGGRIESLKITENSESYHRISANAAIIQYVGVGALRSPGHPSGNQQYIRQGPFLNSWSAANKICVLRQFTNGTVCLMGYYKVRGLRKYMGNEGFAYFLAELIRIP